MWTELSLSEVGCIGELSEHDIEASGYINGGPLCTGWACHLLKEVSAQRNWLPNIYLRRRLITLELSSVQVLRENEKNKYFRTSQER